MNVTILLESRFDRTPDGAVWTRTTFSYTAWSRYLDVFDEVRVVARVRDVAEAPSDGKRVDGDRVSCVAVPYYIGPWQYILHYQSIKRVVKKAVEQADAVVLRISSPIARIASPLMRKNGNPYAVEVAADPYDVFSPGSVDHPLRPVFRRLFTWQTQRQCREACAASYVTSHALQRRYPCPQYSVGISDVVLLDEAFVQNKKRVFESSRTTELIFVGTLEQLYKAPDILIEAVGMCVRKGLDIKLAFVGDGRQMPALQDKVAVLGLNDRIEFLGNLQAGEAVRAQLDQADLFVLPSRQEGLPRALVEAMARGLPCIGSTVGGIPELLPPEDSVPSGDAGALADKIREMITDQKRMVDASNRNLDKASEYREELLQKKRIEFYRYVEEATRQAKSIHEVSLAGS
ncbi:MAG: glycosyltransferase [Candidatus Aquicultor sp.]|nr:glycosyltransferase [Candidatus Aquicultor sp.]